MYKVELEDGKYTIVNNNGVVTVSRHGEQWRNETGDKLMLALLHKIEQYERALAAYGDPRGVHILRAVDKGWDNESV